MSCSTLLSCLNTLVGVKACVEYDGCGTYINSLPGITLERLVAATDVEKQTFVKLWEEIVDEAKQSFRSEFIAKIRECREIITVSDGGCDYDALICENKKELTTAWKYKLATIFFEFLIYSSRVNSFTTIYAEQAKELLTLYQTKYTTALSQAVLVIDLDALNCCAPCTGNPKTVTWLP